MLFTLLTLLLLVLLFLKFRKSHLKTSYYSRKPSKLNYGYKNAPKPAWVVKEVLRLKALSNEGCRSITHMFNRRFSDTKNMTVSKTYVAYTVKKHKRPRSIPLNKIWAMDLTFITNQPETQTPILEIIDHQSRLSLSLTQLQTKSTINILRMLFGKPESIRTDNESMFTSRLFRLSCWFNTS